MPTNYNILNNCQFFKVTWKGSAIAENNVQQRILSNSWNVQWQSLIALWSIFRIPLYSPASPPENKEIIKRQKRKRNFQNKMLVKFHQQLQAQSQLTYSPERHLTLQNSYLTASTIPGNLLQLENKKEKTLQTSKLFSYDQQRSPAIQRACQEPMLHLTHWEAVYTKENFSINVEVTWKSWSAIPKTFVKAPKSPDFFGWQRSLGGFLTVPSRKKHLY